MKDLYGNEITFPEQKLETIQDIQSCGKAIKENMKCTIKMIWEGWKHFKNLTFRLNKIDSYISRTPYKKDII